jgi:hypothetical protein
MDDAHASVSPVAHSRTPVRGKNETKSNIPLIQNIAEAEFTLQLTASQSFYLGAGFPSRTHDKIYFFCIDN